MGCDISCLLTPKVWQVKITIQMIGLYGSSLNLVFVACWKQVGVCSLFPTPLDGIGYFPPPKKGQHAAVTTAHAIGSENNRSIQTKYRNYEP